MSLPFVPGIAERMEELGYDQLLRAYEDKYGKKYPPFRMEIHKEGGLAYMEELRAEAAEKDRDEKLAAAAFDAKIDKALADAKAHNPKLARGALDLDALRASKNQDADIAAAVAAVQKSDAYLFGPAAAEPAPASGTGTSAVPGAAKYTADEIVMRKAADLPVD